MNHEIAERWIEALKSGEYEQGKGELRVGDKYCCLGVLCELAVKDKVIQPGTLDYSCDIGYEYGENHMSGVLPFEVMWWAGMKSQNGAIPSRDSRLTDYNDRHGYDFEQIADLIERHVEEL